MLARELFDDFLLIAKKSSQVFRDGPLVAKLPVVVGQIFGLQNEVGGRDDDQSLALLPKNYLKERQTLVLTH